LDLGMVWFTEDDLRRAAGEASFRRGREYVDAVGELQPTVYGMRATVRGSDDYEVWLGRDGAALVAECACPVGVEGNFCKHCVAVGLALLADGGPADTVDLAEYVRSLDQRELADLVLEQAGRDSALYRKLTLRAAGGTGAPQVAVLRRQLDGALRVRGFVDDGYVARAKDVLDTVRDLVESGHAAEARPLARHAVERLTEAMTRVDDSAGTVAAVCRRALKLYARACATARPNPAKLATWLFELRLAWTTWPTPDLADFAEPLGETGMSAYRTLVRDAWHALPDHSEQEATLRAMREQLAKVEGDVDALVDVLSDDLPQPKAYREIVEVLRRAGRLPEATTWAERGVDETDDLELTELLVRSYVDGLRGDDAVELRKAALRSAPTRLCYARLRDTAVEVKVWSGLRSWALDVLTREPAELVGALLDDDEVPEAWLAAVKYGCVEIEVVRRHGATNPAAVLAAYRELVAACLSRTGRDCYREAALLLVEMGATSSRCGASTAFETFLAELRGAHARRSALLDELVRAGL
jgi:uncharacterized Zn finger protein